MALGVFNRRERPSATVSHAVFTALYENGTSDISGKAGDDSSGARLWTEFDFDDEHASVAAMDTSPTTQEDML